MGRASYMCGMAFACTRPGEPCVQVNANRATHRPTNGKSTVRRQSMQKVAVRCEDFRSQATYIGVSRPPWRLATPTRKAGRRLTVVRTRSLSRDPPSPALFFACNFSCVSSRARPASSALRLHQFGSPGLDKGVRTARCASWSTPLNAEPPAVCPCDAERTGRCNSRSPIRSAMTAWVASSRRGSSINRISKASRSPCSKRSFR